MTRATEYFDVVDADDRVIGRKPREEVHRDKLFHRATHVLLFNPPGQLLLQKRSAAKDCSPGLWDSSAAGHVESGEDYDTCATRELAEELGIHTAAPLERLFKIDASPASEYEFAWIYRFEHDGELRPDTHEIDAVAWLDTAIVDSWLQQSPEQFSPAFTLIWNELRARFIR